MKINIIQDINTAIDLYYDLFDVLLTNEMWKEIDGILETTGIKTKDPYLLITLLTVTLPAKSKLIYRDRFVEYCKTVLNEEGMKGLC